MECVVEGVVVDSFMRRCVVVPVKMSFSVIICDGKL